MKERPILFSTEMVQAIMDNRKTMTRRIVKPQPEAPRAIYNDDECIAIMGTKEAGADGLLRFNWRCERYFPTIYQDSSVYTHKCPYGQVGDVLWVREKWKKNDTPIGWPYHYYAANDTFANPDNEKWKPSIFMPREACRIRLQITDIRAERLQDITEEDAKAEGYASDGDESARIWFSMLWDKINGPDSWDANPYVWVISFKIYTP